MNDLQRYINEGPYREIEGALTSLRDFSRQYIAWLGCPAKQLHWSQKRRIETALRSLGFSIGYQGTISRYGVTRGECGGMHIGNLGEQAQPGSRKFIVDDGYLTETDFTN